MTEEWNKIQIENSSKIICDDNFKEEPKYVCGVYASFPKYSSDGVACATVFDIDTQTVVYKTTMECHSDVEYLTGYLGFREVPIFKQLLEKIKLEKPEYYPHVVMGLGFGVLHDRGYGSLSQLGYEMNIPTIGISETLLRIDGFDGRTTRDNFKDKCKEDGDYILLTGNSGRVLGCALKSSEDSDKPLFVSVGHMISLNTAIKITLNTCLFRTPEPIRQSEMQARLMIKQNQ